MLTSGTNSSITFNPWIISNGLRVWHLLANSSAHFLVFISIIPFYIFLECTFPCSFSLPFLCRSAWQTGWIQWLPDWLDPHQTSDLLGTGAAPGFGREFFLCHMDKVEILAQYFNINRSDLIEEKPPGALTTRDEREVIEFHCTKLIQLIC